MGVPPKEQIRSIQKEINKINYKIEWLTTKRNILLNLLHNIYVEEQEKKNKKTKIKKGEDYA